MNGLDERSQLDENVNRFVKLTEERTESLMAELCYTVLRALF